MKSAKRIISNNIGHKGTINNDAVTRALLLYRNTPLRDVEASPAQLLMGRNLRDFVPAPPSGYTVSRKWIHLLRKREQSITNNVEKVTKLNPERQNLSQLTVGTEVWCQNGKTNKWDKGGIIVELCGFRQYKIRLHGSGRLTVRNRIHLRPTKTFKPPAQIKVEQLSDIARTNSIHPPSSRELHNSVSHPESTVTQYTPLQTSAPRRSERIRNQPDRFGEWKYT